MDLHKEAYTLIKTITNQKIVKINALDDIINNGPIFTPLTIFLKQLNVKGSTLNIYSPKTFNLISFNLLGEKMIFKNFDPDLVNNEHIFYRGTDIFKVQGYDYIDSRYISFGYLFVKRSKALAISEINVIGYIANTLGEHILKRNILTYETGYYKNNVAIEEYEIKGKKPGTILLKWLSYISKGSNATYAFFCILDNNKLIADYAIECKDAKSKMNITDMYVDVTSSPLGKNNMVDFEQISHSNQLLNFFQPIAENLNTEFSYVLNYIRNDSNTIAVWILVYSKFAYTNFNKTRYTLGLLKNKSESIYKQLFQRKTNKMIINPLFKSRNAIENDSIFVLMPFTLDWSDRIWAKILKPTIESMGLVVKRADDLYGHDIVEDIWSEILSSKIIVADITERNPNVFYELGIAHTLGKNVILLTQNVTDIPFDLNRYRHIVYKDNFDGYEILKNQLVGTIENILLVK